MANRSLEEIMKDEGKIAARNIVKYGRTVGLTCDNKRRTLKRLDKDPSSNYFRMGRECYLDYTTALEEELTQILAKTKIRYRYSIPTWDEPTNLFI